MSMKGQAAADMFRTTLGKPVLLQPVAEGTLYVASGS